MSDTKEVWKFTPAPENSGVALGGDSHWVVVDLLANPPKVIGYDVMFDGKSVAGLKPEDVPGWASPAPPSR